MPAPPATPQTRAEANRRGGSNVSTNGPADAPEAPGGPGPAGAGREGPATPSDEELFGRVQRGDAPALSALVERYERELFALLFQLTGGDPHLSDDLFQETFLRALRARATFETGKRFRPWLVAIAVNLVRDEARRRKAQPEVGGLDREPAAPPAAGDGPARAAERRDEDARVRRALAQLGEGEREVLLLHFYQGLTLQEVAAAMAIPVGTVKSRLHTALGRMKELLGE